MITWVAPSIVVSRSGLDTACLTASMCLVVTFCLYRYRYGRYPCLIITVCTSAKSRLISARKIDQVGNTLYCLLQNLVCFLESFRHRGTAVYDLKQTCHLELRSVYLHVFLRLSIPCKRVIHAGSCFKTERLCHNADSQDTHLLCDTLQQPELHLYRYRRPYHR